MIGRVGLGTRFITIVIEGFEILGNISTSLRCAQYDVPNAFGSAMRRYDE